MRTKLLVPIAVLLFSTSGSAQQGGVAPSAPAQKSDLVQCLMRSDLASWQALGLTADKAQHAQSIADRCTKEHNAKLEGEGRARPQDELSEMHIVELKNLLSTDEFNKWKAGCGSRTDTKDQKSGSLDGPGPSEVAEPAQGMTSNRSRSARP